MKSFVYPMTFSLLFGCTAEEALLSNSDYRHGELIRIPVGAYEGFLIQPTGSPDPERRWLWAARCWHIVRQDASSSEDISYRYYVESALEQGFHVAGVDSGVTLGSPAGVKVSQQFYRILVEDFRLSSQVRLIGQSNGALTQYAWATQHPEVVDRILGVFPALDLRSWPGLDKVASDELISYPELGYGLTRAILERRLIELNPIDQLLPLARSGVKLLHLHGDQDTLVPFEPNSGELVRRYRALGGNAQVEIVSGAGHTPGPQFYESERALAFLLE